MQFLPSSILELIEALRSLPGVGQKTAERYAFFLLRQNPLIARKLSGSLQKIERGFPLCTCCQNYAENELCSLCSDPNRNHRLVCVVAEPLDVVALEEAGGFQGTYHVLHGLINPIEGISPDELKIEALLTRIEKDQVSEIILALDSDLTGEATAVYLARQIKPLGVKITRLAQGLPQGGEIGYTDPDTLARALDERREF